MDKTVKMIDVPRPYVPKCERDYKDRKPVRKGSKTYKIWERSEGICHLCRYFIDLPHFNHQLGASVDHIIPASIGGTRTYDNLRPAHAWCNSKRGQSTITEKLKDSIRTLFEQKFGVSADDEPSTTFPSD